MYSKFDAAVEKQLGFQKSATLNMDGICDLHDEIISLMLVIGSIVFYLLFCCIFLFRAGNKKIKRNFYFTYHTELEVTWTILPMLVLIVILIPSFNLLYMVDEMHDFTVTIRAIGRQWYWSYEYPFDKTDGSTFTASFDSYMKQQEDLTPGQFRLLEVDNHVRMPYKEHIRLLISASDVLHSWAMPSFGVKMDGCPGRLNQVALNIYRFGTFYGQCSELCGINHGFMPIVVDCISKKNYLNWLNTFI